MIILFDETETKFDSLGLGVLKDATQCTVNEELNGSFDLEMLYSVSGQLYKKLSLNKIIYAKTNPFDEPQPFRIISISKPIKGTVKINAEHISYDLNGIPVKAVDGKTLADTFAEIKSNSLIQNKFNFRTDISSSRSFKTTQPYNLRAILMGDEEESLVGVYDAELKFDKFDIHMLSKRGANRGAKVCYGQNMTDLTHEITNDRLYTGIFPYYHKETTKTETETEETFKQVYIVGIKEYAEDWLSFTKDGEAYHPLDSNPVQIATEGDHHEEVYAWNSTYQRYEKKRYNETVTLIENVISPEWIKIVWSTFPNVKCVANAKGYYKTMSDTDWGEIKGVGDVIFEGNILKEGLSGLASNMIIYYSEVIPKTKESTSKEVNDIKDVVLDNPIIYLNTIDSKMMAHDRILLVDLSDKFDEEPTKEQLLAEANKYISEYKLGNITTNTTVSFVEVNENQNKFKNFSHIELGDTVQIIYNDIGINTELRVISTSFDAITEKYKNVELGTKKDKLSSQTVQNGDSITSLTNDAGYADITTVNKLIAQTVTADFVNAANASLSKAQIEELKVSKIEMPGVIEASQYVVDKLVANLLLAETAEVSKTLTAGNIKVNGEINVRGGSISISDKENEEQTYFEVDKNGNVKANSVDITGGSLQIGESFSVNNTGDLVARNASISGDLSIEKGTISIGNDQNGFTVRSDGEMVSKNATFSKIWFTPSGTSNENLITYVGYSDDTNKKFNISSDTDIKIFSNNAEISINNQNETLGRWGCRITVDLNNIMHNDITYMVRVDALLLQGQYPEDFGEQFPNHSADLRYVFEDETKKEYYWSGTLNFDYGSKRAYCYIVCEDRLPKGKRWTFKRVSVNREESYYTNPFGYYFEEYYSVGVGNLETTCNLIPKLIEDAGEIDIGAANKLWTNVYAQNVRTPNSPITTSDLNEKENINDISDKYSKMFDELRPVTYKLKGEKHDRLHTGFIAQEIEESMTNNDISSEEFGALCYYTDDNGEKHYSLRYSEFIALNTMEIQKLKKEIEELKNEIKTLKEEKKV